MMIDKLTTEIVKRIFADVGVTPGKMFGKAGIVEPNFKLDKPLIVSYDDQDRSHDIYAGQLRLGSSILRGLLVNLTVEDDIEFLFVFQMDALPYHAMRVVYDDSGDCFLRIFDCEKELWRESSIYMKARILADFERIVSWGLLWENLENIQDLYDVITSLIR